MISWKSVTYVTIGTMVQLNLVFNCCVFIVFVVLIDNTVYALKEWNLVWEEKFNGDNDWKDRWIFATGCGGWGNKELECYTNDDENALQKNGRLVITAVPKKIKNEHNVVITSARMATMDSWLYGKFAMRARLPKGNFFWPAFWMMPKHSVYGSWPRSGEIDIMEYRGQNSKEVCATIHFGSDHSHHRLWGSGDTEFPFDFSETFHEFSLVWNSTGMWWFVDDILYHSQTLETNMFKGFYEGEGQPFDQPFYIVINLAVGGKFFANETFHFNDIASWTKPTYEIDWIRVWQT